MSSLETSRSTRVDSSPTIGVVGGESLTASGMRGLSAEAVMPTAEVESAGAFTPFLVQRPDKAMDHPYCVVGTRPTGDETSRHQVCAGDVTAGRNNLHHSRPCRATEPGRNGA